MNPLRTQVKFFLDQPTTVNQEPVVGVFQRWIQQKALEGQLIDVADYRHVHQGPGVMLIAHDSEYALENRDGRLGLLFTRKRRVDADLLAQLRASFRLALHACRMLEGDPVFQPPLRFLASELEIRFADRLQLPNRPESFELVKADLQTVLAEVYGAHSVEFAPVQQDERYVFTIRAFSPTAQTLADLATLQPHAV